MMTNSGPCCWLVGQPPPTSSVSGLDGYLTALVIGPRFIDP